LQELVPRQTDNSRWKYGEKFFRQDRPKKTAHRSNALALTPSPDLFVHARELLVEANRFDATKGGKTGTAAIGRSEPTSN
jgi:hypothetical protein